MNKGGYERRLRGSPIASSERTVGVRFVGIDIGAESHMLAEVNTESSTVRKPWRFEEGGEGYTLLLQALGDPSEVLVVMEATGHYWQNLFAALVARGFRVALLNPVRSHRFAQEEMLRAKTDGVDALSLARFAAQKRPAATALPDEATVELKELVRYRDRLVQDFGDKVRQLHRLVDLGFPEFTRHVKSLDSMLATTILKTYPNARSLHGVRPNKLAALRYDGRHTVGRELADLLVQEARRSVGAHHGHAYRLQVQQLCEDLDVLRGRIRSLDGDVGTTLDRHEVGKLLTSIEGIGPNTAARLIAELGDPARFRDGAALAAYIGVVPKTSHSGKRTPSSAGLCRIGHARLRRALWMPLLTAVKRNAWLKHYYERLLLRGKKPKVALIASLRKLCFAVHYVARERKAFVPILPLGVSP
jgi:transposase